MPEIEPSDPTLATTDRFNRAFRRGARFLPNAHLPSRAKCPQPARRGNPRFLESDKSSSKGKARKVSAGSANQFYKFHEGCVEDNANTETFTTLRGTLLPMLLSGELRPTTEN